MIIRYNYEYLERKYMPLLVELFSEQDEILSQHLKGILRAYKKEKLLSYKTASNIIGCFVKNGILTCYEKKRYLYYYKFNSKKQQ